MPDSRDPKDALLLRFAGTAHIEAAVDPVEYYRSMSERERPFYLRWDASSDEYWGSEDIPAWMRPYAYLVGHFIENTDASAPFGTGFSDRSDFTHDDDRVEYRAGQYQQGRDGQKWTEDDYRTLLRLVPWLNVGDDSEDAQEVARTLPGPDDQPLFDLPDGDVSC